MDNEAVFADGYFMRPMIVTDVPEDTRLVAEEQFCPAIPVLRYHDLDEAVARANNSIFGLGGSVWGCDIKRATAVAARLDAGTVFVNTHGTNAVNRKAPYGGRQAERQGPAGRVGGYDGVSSASNSGRPTNTTDGGKGTVAMGSMDAKTVIITGAARGLGAAFAEALARQGAHVAICDVRAPDKAVEAIRGEGGNAMGAQCDVTDGAAVTRFVAQVAERFGTVHGLVNNAALFADTEKARMEEFTSADFDRVMAVNVRGAFEMVKAVLPHMKRQGYGKIVNIASGTVFKGDADDAPLCHLERGARRDDAGACPRTRWQRHLRELPGTRLDDERGAEGTPGLDQGWRGRRLPAAASSGSRCPRI